MIKMPDLFSSTNAFDLILLCIFGRSRPFWRVYKHMMFRWFIPRERSSRGRWGVLSISPRFGSTWLTILLSSDHFTGRWLGESCRGM